MRWCRDGYGASSFCASLGDGEIQSRLPFGRANRRLTDISIVSVDELIGIPDSTAYSGNHSFAVTLCALSERFKSEKTVYVLICETSESIVTPDLAGRTVADGCIGCVLGAGGLATVHCRP